MIHSQANVFYFWSIENRLKKNKKQQIPAGYRIHITCFIVSQLSVAHLYFILLSPNLEPQTSPILFELTKTIDFFLAYQVLTRLWFHDDTIQIYHNAWCKRSKKACHDVLCMLYLWCIRFCSVSKWSKSSQSRTRCRKEWPLHSLCWHKTVFQRIRLGGWRWRRKSCSSRWWLESLSSQIIHEGKTREGWKNEAS